MKKSRNGLIEFVRFFAIVSIACYHYEWLYISRPVHLEYGYIWVEFFFVVSGYFLVQNYNNKTPINYVYGQIKKLYPLYLAAFVFCFAIKNWGCALDKCLAGLWTAKWEILLCYNYGFNNNYTAYNVGGAPSYISVLILCTIIIHFLLKNHKEFFVCLFAPLVIVVSYGKIININGNLSGWVTYDGFLPIGIYRGMADMCVGALFALLIKDRLEKSDIHLRRIILVICLIFVAALYLSNSLAHSDLVIYVIVFGLLVSVLDTMNISKGVNQVGLHLGQISTPIFFFHSGVIEIMKNNNPNIGYWLGMLILLIVLVVFSSAICFLRRVKKNIGSY